MKYLIFSTILVLTITFTYSQNYFQTVFGDENNKVGLLRTMQNSQNEYIMYGGFQKDTIRGAYIVRLSQEGVVLEEELKPIIDSIFVPFNIIQKNNNNYLLTSVIRATPNYQTNNFIVLSETDDDFNILTEKRIKFPLDTMYIYDMDVREINDNEILCYGNCRNDNYSWATFLYKLSTNGDSLLFKVLPDTGNSDLEVNSNKIYFMGPQWYNEISVYNYSNFELDTVVRLSETIGYPFGNMGFVEFLSDSTFVVYGEYPNLDENYVSVLLDTNFNVLFRNTNIGQSMVHGNTPQFNALDINNNNEILTAINYDYILNENCFLVTKTDNELNIIWEKFHEINHYRKTTWFSVYATNDGGCIMFGIDLGYNTSVAVKMAPNGNITHINGEPSDQKAKEIILYPNPATTELTIQKAVQVGNCNVEFYNIEGKKVFYQNLTNSTTKIDISSLQKGSYIYKITDNSKIIESGKWIKQ